ncbi:MAG: DUF4349 domain-containing protein [Butyrivibrio sp.]|nr:DUF4349 domain-containing protein [Butyrivibrio sp.]
MKKRNLTVFLTAICVTAFTLAGCGSSESGSKSSTTAEYATEAAYDSSFESKSVYQTEGTSAGVEAPEEMDEAAGAEDVGEVADVSRKLITTMNISAETEELDGVLSNVQSRVKELGGYIESSDIYNGSNYYSGSKPKRSAYLTLRIPANNLDKFIETVENSTNITNKSTSVEDVTLNYVDIESKKKALTAEENRLLEILESAETVEDVIAVESRLSEVRYQIESIESQLRTYDNKINYSTVHLDINEVVKFTPTQEKSAGERMREGFIESIAEVGALIAEGFIWFVIHIPQIVLALLLVAIIIIAIIAIDKAGKKKRIANMAKMQNMQQTQQGFAKNSSVKMPAQNMNMNMNTGNGPGVNMNNNPNSQAGQKDNNGQ